MVIRFRGIWFVSCFAVLSAAPLGAQSVAQVGGPAEQPPASFTGQQYVDSRGCVFMRAGFSGNTTWVPRIGRDRKAMCNAVTPAEAAARLNADDAQAQMPIMDQGNAAQMARQATPATVAPLAPAAPMETIASDMQAARSTGIFAPAAMPGMATAMGQMPQPAANATGLQPMVLRPQQAVAASPAGAGLQMSSACPANAPVLQYLPLRTGGDVAVCTRGDGTATGWVSPNFGSGALGGAFAQGQGSQIPGASGGIAATGSTGGYVQTVIAGQPIVAPRRETPTYVAAWKDDRLNPYRGIGTAQGWADQARVWTRRTPAKTHADIARKRAWKSGSAFVRMTGSTMSAAPDMAAVRMKGSTMSAAPDMVATVPIAASMGQQMFVQVGTFGQPSNADTAVNRLAGMGLPVALSKGSKGGQQLVAVLAGPFASAADAQQALFAARSAGFGDAFIR